MIKAILKYIPCALFVYVMKLITFPLAFVFCLFTRQAEETAVTGYPSQFPGKMRDHIIKPFWLFSTFDDCADAYWYSGRAEWLGKDQAYYDAHWWIRYYCRLLWMWRNPAYGWARLVGFDQNGMTIRTVRNQDDLWKSGKRSISLWTATNAKGQRAFLYQAQIYFYRHRCLELVLGYKFPWKGDPTNTAMLACRINPFKSYHTPSK